MSSDMIQLHTALNSISEALIANYLQQNQVKTVYDDVNIFKEVIFNSHQSEEEVINGNKLTSLVRESYLKHLQLTLVQNYETWLSNNNSNKSSNAVETNNAFSQTDIEKCVKLLEQKALRSCMIASLYQKAMVNMINDIKHKTKEMNLYDDLSNVNKLTYFTSDKSIQTDLVKTCNDTHNSNVNIRENQNNNFNDSDNNIKQFKSTSLLDLPLPDPKDVLLSLSSSNFVNNSINNSINGFNNNTIKFKKSKDPVAKVQPQPRKSIVNKVSPSDTPLNSMPKSKRLKLNSDCKNNNNFCINNANVNNNNLIMCTPAIDETTTSKIKSNIKIDNFDLFAMLTDDYNSNSFDNYMNKDNNQIYNPEIINSPKDTNICSSLDNRLAEMGVFNDEQSNSNISLSKLQDDIIPVTLKPVKGHRGSWYSEMMAHCCNFSNIYSVLDESTKAKVDEKLIKYFKTEDHTISDAIVDEDIVELNDENTALCRKRTANMVVAELKPYYQLKRINNRYIFKEFAKCVTNAILIKTYAPDSQLVHQFITNYFTEHTSVQSVDDIRHTL